MGLYHGQLDGFKYTAKMNTKLVYVLTSAPEATYIEQALMSVYSARHYNPNAHIVLVVDNLTDQLFVEKRAEILDYISEKIVISFDDESMSPMYRSRWLKTRVRELIQGDFLYIDCDTICCKSLEEADLFEYEIGAVPDNNTLFQNDRYKADTCKSVLPIGCDISKEKHYFSSGVIYCKDTLQTHQLFTLWHKYWQEGLKAQIQIDQPSLAKANIEMEHQISSIDDVYNYVLYTESPFLVTAAILHITSKPKISFLFQQKLMSIVREHGLLSWIKDLILHVHTTYLPFDYTIRHSSMRQRIKWINDIAYSARIYGKYVDHTYSEWQFKVAIAPLVRWLLTMHMYRLAAFLWLSWRHVIVHRAKPTPPNVCSCGILKKK